MARWAWRTLADGHVEVDRQDGKGYSAAGLNDVGGVPAGRARVLEWLPLVLEKAAKYRVPPAWILAVILAESAGNPDAENACCVGLMAIYAAVHGKTREWLKNPDNNVDYGTSLLARSKNAGLDLPATASIHVAGGAIVDGKLVPHPSTSDTWGMREHEQRQDADGSYGYIDRVVRGNNMFLDHVGDQLQLPGVTSPPSPSAAGAAGPLAPFLLGSAAGFAVGAYAIPRLGKHMARALR